MAWTTATTRASGFLVTAAVWNSEHVDNMNFLKEVGYAQITAPVSPTATTEATANSVVSLGAITYEAVPHLIEFFSPAARADLAAAARQLQFVLCDGATVIVGLWGQCITPAAASDNKPVHLSYRFTPTAAAHTYNVKAWVSAGTGNIAAGAAGAAAYPPAFIRVTRIPA